MGFGFIDPPTLPSTDYASSQLMVSQLVCFACRLAHVHACDHILCTSITPHHIHTHPPHTPISCMNPAAEPMQVESSGGSSVAGGGIGAGVDVVYPTPLPILTPINVFMDADGNLLNVSELNSHTAVIGRSGEGKTHLTCHLIMQWAPIKGWNHGVMAIMPRSVRARAHALLTSPLHDMRSHHHCTTCSLITLAQHALTSPFAQHDPCTTCAHITIAQHALSSPLHNMRSHHPLHNMRSHHPCTVRLLFGTRRRGITISSTRRRCTSSTTTPARMTGWG
jgi:hypothetical protein